MRRILIFIGKPGSGKDTQIKKLVEVMSDCVVIRTGDGVRELAKTNKDIAQQLDKGEMIDNQIINQIFTDDLMATGPNAIIISDGFPRILEQAIWLEDFIKQNDTQLIVVFLLNISDEISYQRLSLRNRTDDREKIIKHRIELYYQQTEKVVEFYRRQGLLREIDATGSVEEVHQNVMRELQ